MPAMPSIQDQVIVITGASAGIGAATAELAVSRGAQLGDRRFDLLRRHDARA